MVKSLVTDEALRASDPSADKATGERAANISRPDVAAKSFSNVP